MIEPDKVDRIAVVGAGTIGAGWASLFLAHGKSVAVYDPSPNTRERVLEFVARAQPAMRSIGISGSVDLDRLTFYTDVKSAVDGAQLIQENGPEEISVKRQLFSQFECVLADNTVVASSSSGIMPSELQAGRVRPGRYLVAHPFNPPHLMPLIEICGGKDTDDRVIEWAIGFYKGIGKHPVRLKKEVPGHIANRLAAALWREAINLVVEGVATVADVDDAVKYGPGLRSACMGPHMAYHLGGGAGGIEHFIAHLGPAFESWWDDLGQPALSPETIQALKEGLEAESGAQSLEKLVKMRDTQLIAVLNALAACRADATDSQSAE